MTCDHDIESSNPTCHFAVDKQLLGTETVRLMRSRGLDAVVCGLSANDLENPFKEAGADAFWLKPFPADQIVLEQELHRLLISRSRHFSSD